MNANDPTNPLFDVFPQENGLKREEITRGNKMEGEWRKESTGGVSVEIEQKTAFHTGASTRMSVPLAWV